MKRNLFDAFGAEYKVFWRIKPSNLNEQTATNVPDLEGIDMSGAMAAHKPVRWDNRTDVRPRGKIQSAVVFKCPVCFLVFLECTVRSGSECAGGNVCLFFFCNTRNKRRREGTEEY
jgi:hypothetical protein